MSFSAGETPYGWGDWSVLEGTGTHTGLTGSGKTEITCAPSENDTLPCHEDHDGHIELTN